MAGTMIVGIAVLALLLIVVGFSFASRRLLLTLLAVFVAFYLVLLGLRMMLGEINGGSVLLGNLLASLGLTFFWLKLRGDR
jgi:formate hydrogenlyase subunit 3/multisubunit Na+/H+ antiporter MnhD subunit